MTFIAIAPTNIAMETLKNNMELITFILACIGSVGTISGWIYYWVTTRKNIFVRIIAFHQKNETILSYMAFENKSRLPVSITDISLLIDGNPYPCEYMPKKVMSHERTVGGRIVSSQDYYNIQLPIELGSLGATSGYVLFVLPKGVRKPDTKVVTLQISSNRGKAMKMTLSLDQVAESF